MFVKLKYHTWIIFNTVSLSHHQGNLWVIELCQGLDNGVTRIFI